MNAPMESVLIQQHLIDPEICIRCNTCEATCPVGAITHDSRNYVVDADKCNLCMACVPPCPTGSIDNWRQMPKVRAYSVEEQLGWDTLPPSSAVSNWRRGASEAPAQAPSAQAAVEVAQAQGSFNSAQYGASQPPGRRPMPIPISMAPKRPKKPSPPPSPAMFASPKWARTMTPITSCSTSEPCLFRSLRANRSA